MAEHVCPWWVGYFLASPIRHLVTAPRKIISPYVSDGMAVLEPGPGMGFFTLELARLAGPEGRVIAVDIQPKMLDTLKRRARRARLLDRIDARRTADNGLGLRDLAGKIDFVLAFAVVHEVPDQAAFFAEIAASLKRGGKILFCEPAGHITEDRFASSLDLAKAAGLLEENRLVISGYRSAVLTKE